MKQERNERKTNIYLVWFGKNKGKNYGYFLILFLPKIERKTREKKTV